jgi:hypothetical protein
LRKVANPSAWKKRPSSLRSVGMPIPRRTGRRFARGPRPMTAAENDGKGDTPPLFVCVAGKGLEGGDFVCVAGKGVARRVPCSVDRERGYLPHPRVFREKSPQAVENKGKERGKEREEILRVPKLLKCRGLRFERCSRLRRLLRDNTQKYSTSVRICQFQSDKSMCSNDLRDRRGRNEPIAAERISQSGCSRRETEYLFYLFPIKWN